MRRYIALLLVLFLAQAPMAHAAAAPQLQMRVTVAPNPMYADSSREYVQVATQPRIICVAFVLYDDGREPASFEHAQAKVTGYNGIAVWRWHDLSRASGGIASVSCTNGPTTRTVTLRFRVLPVAVPRHVAPAQPASPPVFSVRIAVTLNPMRYGTNPARLTVYAASGARCTAGVFYDNGQVPPTFSGAPQTLGGGSAAWIWHEETQSESGTATVTCTYRGKTLTATTIFSVTH